MPLRTHIGVNTGLGAPNFFFFFGAQGDLGDSQDHKPTPRASLIRVVETVVLENGRFVPCRKQVVLTKIGENSDVAFCPQKQGILLLGPRKSTKMTKMAGATPAK